MQDRPESLSPEDQTLKVVIAILDDLEHLNPMFRTTHAGSHRWCMLGGYGFRLLPFFLKQAGASSWQPAIYMQIVSVRASAGHRSAQEDSPIEGVREGKYAQLLDLWTLKLGSGFKGSLLVPRTHLAQLFDIAGHQCWRTQGSRTLQLLVADAHRAVSFVR